MPEVPDQTTGLRSLDFGISLRLQRKNTYKDSRFFGDSKLVIDWDMNKVNIQNIRLEPITREIRETFNSFCWLSFHHILRELNSKVDKLSNDVVLLNPGTFSLYEFHDGVETEAMEVHLWDTIFGPFFLLGSAMIIYFFFWCKNVDIWCLFIDKEE